MHNKPLGTLQRAPARTAQWPWDWSSHPVHSEVLASDSRFRVVVAARRSGKSTMARTACILEAVARPGSLSWIVTPTWAAGREIHFDALRTEVPRAMVSSVHRSDMVLTLRNGSRIACKSADRPDLLRGRGLHLVVVDEYQTCTAPDLWSAVLRPALADTAGRALFLGTPMGRTGPLFEAYQRGVRDEPGWRSWRLTAAEAGMVPADEIAAARLEAEKSGPTALRLWAREWEADFSAFVGAVYGDAWDPRRHVVDEVPDPSAFGRCVVGLDFGFSESHPGVALVLGRTPDLRWWAVDELAETGRTADWWAAALRRLHDTWGFRTAWCDPSRPDSIVTLQRGAKGYAVREASNEVFNGIVAVATALETDRLRVHRRCERLIAELPAYRWETDSHGNALEKPHKAFDDANDCLRYGIASEGQARQLWMA